MVRIHSRNEGIKTFIYLLSRKTTITGKNIFQKPHTPLMYLDFILRAHNKNPFIGENVVSA